jgi:hypothetical protein
MWSPEMWRWPARRWLAAVAAAGVAALAIGIPTGIIRTPLYTRMTPVQWWNYPIWTATALLSGLIVATYVRQPVGDSPPDHAQGTGVAAGLLSFLAVGCPVCNKIVVAAIGVSGALDYWAPIQPVLGVASLGLLAWALYRRLDGERRCRLTPPTPPPHLLS